MASVHETEQDSDEDCEVYFLKPVNEYNIVDKIKEANQELFADADAEDGDELVLANQINRKVSFAANLEEYEPKNGINLKELQEKLGKDFTENDEENLTNSGDEQKLEIITEEEDEINDNVTNICQETEIAHEEEQSPTDINNEETNDEFEKATVVEQASSDKKENVDENEILEEICEEIQIMDMENDKLEESKETKYDSPSTLQRKIFKQITFDCTKEEDESDNKSLTNLLISDSEIFSDKEELEYQEYNCNEPVNDDTDNENNKYSSTSNVYYDEEEEDDDDKLSIIVSSYLADDMAYDKTCLFSSSLKCSPRINKSRKLPFNKRFSFRRKAKSSNAIASSSNHHHSSSNRRFIPPPEVTDLKLHYKTCCEYKNSQQKLPKYTGYISEYGLSREQLLERERILQQKQRGKIIETLKNSEADIRKMHDNERAFTTWLKNKMRFPINKTRNMFDVKRPFGLRKCTSVGGNALLNDDSKQMLGNTKYRSISAKFGKS